ASFLTETPAASSFPALAGAQGALLCPDARVWCLHGRSAIASQLHCRLRHAPPMRVTVCACVCSLPGGAQCRSLSALYPSQQIRTDSFSQAFFDYLRAIDLQVQHPVTVPYPSSYAGVATRDLEQHTDTYLDRSGLEGAVQQLHGSGQLDLAGAFAAARATTQATGAGADAAVAAARAAGVDTKQFVYYLLAVALLLRQCCGVLHMLHLYIGFACHFQVTWARYAAVLGINTERVRLMASHNMACQLKNNSRHYGRELHQLLSDRDRCIEQQALLHMEQGRLLVWLRHIIVVCKGACSGPETHADKDRTYDKESENDQNNQRQQDSANKELLVLHLYDDRKEEDPQQEKHLRPAAFLPWQERRERSYARMQGCGVSMEGQPSLVSCTADCAMRHPCVSPCVLVCAAFLEALNAAHYRHCVTQDGYVHCVAGDAFNKPSSYAGVATRDLEQHTDTYLDRSGLEGAVQQLHGSGQLDLAGAFAAARATTQATGAGADAAVAAARAAGVDTKQFVYYLLAVALPLRQCCGVLHMLHLYIGFACHFQVTWARYAAVLGINTERVRLMASHNMACQLKNNSRHYGRELHQLLSDRDRCIEQQALLHMEQGRLLVWLRHIIVVCKGACSGPETHAFLEALNAAHYPLTLYPSQQIRTDSFSFSFKRAQLQEDPVQGPGDPVQGPTDKTLLGILTALCARTLLGFLQTLFLVLQTLFGLFPTLGARTLCRVLRP
ncbi:hypothetical protein QJQ45_019053, partial [Haematococcus lacustris]